MKWDDGFVGYENSVYTLYSASIYYILQNMRCQTGRNGTDENVAGYILSYLTKMVDAKCDDDGVLNW